MSATLKRTAPDQLADEAPAARRPKTDDGTTDLVDEWTDAEDEALDDLLCAVTKDTPQASAVIDIVSDSLAPISRGECATYFEATDFDERMWGPATDAVLKDLARGDAYDEAAIVLADSFLDELAPVFSAANNVRTVTGTFHVIFTTDRLFASLRSAVVSMLSPHTNQTS